MWRRGGGGGAESSSLPQAPVSIRLTSLRLFENGKIGKPLLNEVMSRIQWHIGVHDHQLMFKVPMQCISFHAFLCNGYALSSDDLLTFMPLIPFEMSSLHGLAVSQCIFDAIWYDSFGINHRLIFWTLKYPIFLALIFEKDWEVPVSRCLPKTGSFTKATTNIPAPPPKKNEPYCLINIRVKTSGQLGVGCR